jgi:hypothetical protein
MFRRALKQGGDAASLSRMERGPMHVRQVQGFTSSSHPSMRHAPLCTLPGQAVVGQFTRHTGQPPSAALCTSGALFPISGASFKAFRKPWLPEALPPPARRWCLACARNSSIWP